MFEWWQVVFFVCQLAVLAFFIQRAIGRGEFRTRFSLRFLFGLVTIIAVLLGIFQLPLQLAVKFPLFVTFLCFALWILTAIEDGPR